MDVVGVMIRLFDVWCRGRWFRRFGANDRMTVFGRKDDVVSHSDCPFDTVWLGHSLIVA